MTATLAPADDAPAPEPAEAGPATRPVPAALAPWHDPQPLAGWIWMIALAIAAGLTRFWSLGFPQTKVFDEAYYPVEAQEILRFGYEDNRGYMFIVHPPLGKYLIGVGEWMVDGSIHAQLTNTIGWRIMPALFGCLTVLVVTRTARRLTRSNFFGGLAGLLVVLDGMSLVLARVALLDVFLQFFVTAAFGALLIDRDKMRARLAGLIADGVDLSGGVPSLGPRPWRLAAGVLFGLACATKWTALSFFLFFIVLSWFWDRSALKTAGVRRSWRYALLRSLPAGLVSLVLAPVATYLLCNLGWFAGENAWGRHYADEHGTVGHLHVLGMKVPLWWGWVPSPIRDLGSNIYQAYSFHEQLDSPHSYQSNPWSWLVLGRPVDFYYQGGQGYGCPSSSCSKQILLLGTPLLWWAFVPMLLWLAWHWATTRDWRAGAIWVGFAAGWLVWFQDLKRTMFLFYMAPLVPFLIYGVVLGLGMLAGPALRATGDAVRDYRALRRRRWGQGVLAVYIGAVVLDFAWMWLIFAAVPESYTMWHDHMWLPSWV